eukprot:g1677.t1
MPFYLEYLAKWPDYFMVNISPNGRRMAYVMGKAEGKGEDWWHGHVTAITVAPEYRRLGLARSLMNILETVTTNTYNGYFVDLFVRKSNGLAIKMYEQFGYAFYRRVLGYYSGEEDAWDMRKACSRDPEKKSMIPLPEAIDPSELEHWPDERDW